MRAGESAQPNGDTAPLLDDLSTAELRVIRYLPSNLKAPEIASELFVSTNTIRTHLRHIYAKLAVHGRAEAVARARELGLLAPSHRRPLALYGRSSCTGASLRDAPVAWLQSRKVSDDRSHPAVSS